MSNFSRNFAPLNNTGKNNGAEFVDKMSDSKFLKQASCFRNYASVVCFRDGGEPDGAGRQLLQSGCGSLRLSQRREHGSRRGGRSGPAVRHIRTLRARSGTVPQLCIFAKESELITAVDDRHVMRGYVVVKQLQRALNLNGKLLILSCFFYICQKNLKKNMTSTWTFH